MNKEDLLKQFSLKQNRAFTNSNSGEEPGMPYWQGYYDAMNVAYTLVAEMHDDC